MFTRFVIKPEWNVVIMTSKKIGGGAVLQVMKEVFADKDWRPEIDLIIDLRGAEDQVEVADLRRFASYLQQTTESNPLKGATLLLSLDRGSPYTVTAAQTMGRFESRAEVFSNLADGVKWLGLEAHEKEIEAVLKELMFS